MADQKAFVKDTKMILQENQTGVCGPCFSQQGMKLAQEQGICCHLPSGCLVLQCMLTIFVLRLNLLKYLLCTQLVFFFLFFSIASGHVVCLYSTM